MGACACDVSLPPVAGGQAGSQLADNRILRPPALVAQMYMPTANMIGFSAAPPLVAKLVTISLKEYIEGECCAGCNQVPSLNKRHFRTEEYVDADC